ncbi:MAG: hypothetical protein NTX22_01910 [Ignavibacteriales bacterium]|nr:hypothetical protein [Ignavibacteriales bacterium]
MKIFNSFSEEIEILACEIKKAGVHKINSIETRLTNGVFLYQLKVIN